MFIEVAGQSIRRGVRQTTLETQRLLLRPIELGDLDEYVALHADPEVTRFIRPLDRAVAEDRLRRDESEWREAVTAYSRFSARRAEPSWAGAD